MPVLDGRKTYARLRSAGARMPIVLMSGFEVDVQAERGDGTVVEFLAKPFTLADVTRVLSAVLATTTCSAG
jgi:FixJ family two-component response regulator